MCQSGSVVLPAALCLCGSFPLGRQKYCKYGTVLLVQCCATYGAWEIQMVVLTNCSGCHWKRDLKMRTKRRQRWYRWQKWIHFSQLVAVPQIQWRYPLQLTAQSLLDLPNVPQCTVYVCPYPFILDHASVVRCSMLQCWTQVLGHIVV